MAERGSGEQGRHDEDGQDKAAGTAKLIGQQGLVLERITQDGGTVKIDGESWTARSFVDSDVFEPGERVSIVEIKGATALVTD